MMLFLAKGMVRSMLTTVLLIVVFLASAPLASASPASAPLAATSWEPASKEPKPSQTDASGIKDVSSAELKNLTEEEVKTIMHSVTLRVSDVDALKQLPLRELVVADDWVAVGGQNQSAGTYSNVVGILDLQGNVEQVFAFNTSGGYQLYVDEKRQNLVLYIARSGIYCTIDRDGTLRQVEGDTPAAAERYRKQGKNFTDQDGNAYYLSAGSKGKDLVFPNKTAVMKRTGAGAEEVFFETDYSQGRWAMTIVPFLIMIGIVLFLEWKYHIFENRKTWWK